MCRCYCGTPYFPLEWNCVLPPTKLGIPPGVPTTELNISSWRLNLLAAHSDLLWLAIDDYSVYEYAITRYNGLNILPKAHYSISPSTAINNVRFVNFDSKYGGPTLLLAGGSATIANAPGSLSTLRITPVNRTTATPVVDTFFLNDLRSAWGLSADPSTGRVALSTNSYASVILQLPIVDTEDMQDDNRERVPEFVGSPIVCTHYGNIPTIAFSPTGNLLASASIDTTFAIFDVSKNTRNARRLLQSPQLDSATDAEWCWNFTWLSPTTPRRTHRSDPAWPAIMARRKSPAPLQLATLLRDNALLEDRKRCAIAAAAKAYDSMTLTENIKKPLLPQGSPCKRRRVRLPDSVPLPLYNDVIRLRPYRMSSHSRNLVAARVPKHVYRNYRLSKLTVGNSWPQPLSSKTNVHGVEDSNSCNITEMDVDGETAGSASFSSSPVLSQEIVLSDDGEFSFTSAGKEQMKQQMKPVSKGGTNSTGTDEVMRLQISSGMVVSRPSESKSGVDTRGNEKSGAGVGVTKGFISNKRSRHESILARHGRHAASECSKKVPEDSLFVVARQNTLTLHRLLGKPGSGSEQLDCVEPFSAAGSPRGHAGVHTRLSDVIEVAELSVLFVVEQYGGGVAVVRIVRHCGEIDEAEEVEDAHERYRYALVVEGMIGGSSRKWMAGWCMVKRQVRGAQAAAVWELFMLSGDGMIEGYEVGRRAHRDIYSWALVV